MRLREGIWHHRLYVVGGGDIFDHTPGFQAVVGHDLDASCYTEPCQLFWVQVTVAWRWRTMNLSFLTEIAN